MPYSTNPLQRYAPPIDGNVHRALSHLIANGASNIDSVYAISHRTNQSRANWRSESLVPSAQKGLIEIDDLIIRLTDLGREFYWYQEGRRKVPSMPKRDYTKLMDRPTYDFAELNIKPARVGAMDFINVPSRTNNRREYRKDAEL
jgi:hypothetical protein